MTAHRILLVDDDPIQRKAGALLLQSRGFDVTTAYDGVVALEILQCVPIDAVISDVLMPRMDGFSLCETMHRDVALSRIPVILVSSNYIEDDDRELARRMGASDCVVRDPELAAATTALGALPEHPVSFAPGAAPGEHHARIVHQLERQAALNSTLALALGRTEASLRLSDEHLRQTQKMESLGELAGAIAHDFNNALSVVLSYSELILGTLAPDEPMREDVEAICKAGRGAAALTKQLLMFGRQQLAETQVVDLGEVIAGIDKMLQRLVGVNIRLFVLRTERLGLVHIDPSSIEQVMMNLVINARDAMPAGGSLTIETANVTFDEAYVEAHPCASLGRHVMIAVTDTGTGMDQATQARIFERFFTTKAVGKGTGLGLSTVLGIVQQAKGSLVVDSELGRGTVFQIYLPCVDAVAHELTPILLGAGARVRGKEVILLVEDTDQVRSVAAAILRRRGYQVVEARNAGEAMLLIETPMQIDLLLTDVVMPQMSGPSLAKRIAGGRPNLKVVYISGCVDDVLLGQLAYLPKPFTPDTLAAKVREVLDQGASGVASIAAPPSTVA